jgi:hypothetical protein
MTARIRDYADLESPIIDLSLMASVTATMTETFVKALEASRDIDASIGSVVESLEREFEELTFCIYHLNTMTKSLSKLYLAELEAVA